MARERDEDTGGNWLLAEGRVLAALEVAASRADRRRGLRGRDEFEGALLLRPCRQVHSFGMRFPIDVAFCTDDGEVLRVSTLRPGRISTVVPRAAFVIEARAGSFARWGLSPGERLEIT
ncbi:MAG: DUF192 domain-containing protein [Actinobacteria bacterium]|nr:DUF192 domain-containing protein [Actinomycetota bacterium]